MNSQQQILQFDKVSKSFSNKIVIDQLSLNIPINQTTAIVGESGSGKSTLLQLAIGLIKADTGRISVFSEEIDYSSLPSLRRRMGYAVQGAGLFPHLTAKENVTLVAKLSGWAEQEIGKRYQHLLNLLGLSSEMSDRYPHSLSGGQQQRFSLCRAMMMNPSLMLLDEPFSALDPITRDSIHQEFINLQKAEARSIVIVTHDMSEAMKLAQHLVVLKEGRLVKEVSTTDFLAQLEGNDSDIYLQEFFKGIDS